MVINFECTKCGECCKGFTSEYSVMLYPRDVEKLSKYFNITEPEFLRRFTVSKKSNIGENSINFRNIKYKNGICIFLDAENKCTVHEIKPVQCERTPFNYFWRAMQEVKFDCMKNVSVPKEWNTDQLDYELTKELLSKKGDENGCAK